MTTDDLIKILKKHPNKEILIYEDGVFKKAKHIEVKKVDGFCNWTYGAIIDVKNKDNNKNNSIIIY